MDPETPYRRHRPAAGAEGGRGSRRHDAPRRAGGRARSRNAHTRGLRRRGDDLRAPPPPLRGEQRVSRSSCSTTASSSAAPSRRDGSSRSSSCRIIRGSSPRSSIPSSSRARHDRRRSSASSCRPRSTVRGSACTASKSRSTPRARITLVPPEVLDLFLELARCRAHPGEERAVADRVGRYLRTAVSPSTKTAAARRSALRSATSTAHSSRPRPASRSSSARTSTPFRDFGSIEPVVEDGVVRNGAGTILGADDKAAVAAMLEATRRVLAENRPHAGIELLFTARRKRSASSAPFAFDHTRLRARIGYVYDQAAPIGTVILGAPFVTVARGDLPRPCRARGHVSRRRPVGDRRRGTGDRGVSPRPGRPGARRPTSARSPAEPPPTSSPSGARFVAEAAVARRATSSPTWSARCRTRSRSPPASPNARSRRRRARATAATGSRRATRPSCAPPARSRAAGYEVRLRALRRRRRRERLQRAGPPLRQPRERDGRHPHADRAHRRRRPRGDGRGDAGTRSTARPRSVSALRPRAMRIGVAKEIKPDEYRVALTPAGALELINHGHEVSIETGAGVGSAFPDESYERVGARIASRRRGLGGAPTAAQGQGADRLRVRGGSARADPLHLPAHRSRRAADARASRLGDHRGRLRDGRGRSRAAAARADVGGRGPARLAGGRVLPREAARGPRAAARRSPGRRARHGRDRRRRCRRLQRGDHRARARRSGDDSRAFDRPDAPPRGDPSGQR